MNNLYTKLSDAQEIDSKWQSSIIVDITTPKGLSDTLALNQPKGLAIIDNSTTDIIPLLKESSLKEMMLLINELQYPVGTSFVFLVILD